MRIITDSEISDTTMKVYLSWFNISDKLSILDIMVLNNVGYCNDRDHQCGLKELKSELRVSKQRISTSIFRWIELGYLSEESSKTDRRRTFYKPTQKMRDARGVAFKDIRLMHEKLREQQ